MLETVNLERYLEGEKSLDWIICGAETGRNAREMNDAWAKNLFEQCNRFKKPFFFKKTSNGSDRFIINADGMRQFCRNFPNFRKELFD
jgi:protein gp37